MSFRCLDCGREHGDGESCQFCGFVPASISERERAKAAAAESRWGKEARKAAVAATLAMLEARRKKEKRNDGG